MNCIKKNKMVAQSRSGYLNTHKNIYSVQEVQEYNKKEGLFENPLIVLTT